MAKSKVAVNDSWDRMLEAAITLMRGTGLSGAGINEIVPESAAPKGSVCHFLPQGKLSLAAQALALFSQRAGAFIDEALASRQEPAQ